MAILVKTSELAEMNNAELAKQLEQHKKELAALRVNQVAGATAAKLAQIHDVRKAIARVLTISHKKQRDELRKFYQNKKYIPLDLRPKQTRAIRRRLTANEANKKTERQRKRAQNFPMRKFAIKA